MRADPVTSTGAVYFSRAGRSGRDAVQERTPELRPLAKRTVALFGLGCVGAPSAMELARAAVGELRVLDHDHVDPATTGRWPFGLSAAGLRKAEVITEAITKDYPSTSVTGIVHRLGGVRAPKAGARTDGDVLRQMTEGASLIYDATAELGVHHLLSDRALELGLPYIGVVGTQGGWGGKVFRVLPDRTEGCWMCYRLACEDGTIPEPPADPKGTVQPVGCADPTFTGAGFDMAQVALTGVRIAVATLCGGTASGYPEAAWDVLHIALRADDGKLIAPAFAEHIIKRHAQCPRCRERK